MKDWLRGIFRALFDKSALDREMDEETRSHLDMRARKNLEDGLSLEAARRAANLQFGSKESIHEACREARGGRWLEEFWEDIRFGLRVLRRNPGYTAITAITLALGIGANTAIFSVIHGVLLKALPFPETDRLVMLWESSPDRGIEQQRVSGPNFLDWRAQNSVFSDMAVNPAWDDSDFKLALREGVVGVRGMFASASMFTTLGGAPLLGRTFLPEEDEPKGNRAAVLSFGLWQRRFGADSNVIGQTITVEKFGTQQYMVVGVMPPDYGALSKCDLWLPLGWMGVTLNERRSAHWHEVTARLKPGVSLAQAHAQMNMIQARLKETYPAEMIGTHVVIAPLIQQAVGRNFQRALYVLWGVVAAVLLIACVNVANLTLAHAASRQREIALRLALGAKRMRIVRQLITESLLLALLGGAAGVYLAELAVKIFVAASPGNIPRIGEVTVDRTAMLFTLGVALLTGILFSLIPAWRSSRPDLNETLKAGSSGNSGEKSAHTLKSALVAAEVALAIVLLVGAGLMLRSFANLVEADRGFQSDQVLTVDLDFTGSGYDSWVHRTATRPQIDLNRILEKVRRLPGVQSVGAAYRPIRKNNGPPNQTFSIYGQPPARDEEQLSTEANALTPGFLEAFGIPLLSGRDFRESDTLDAPGVVLVNAAFVRRYFPNEEPLGKFITGVKEPGPLGSRDRLGVPVWDEIVGVVGDVKSLGIPPETTPEIYHSYWQYPMQTPALAVRAGGDPGRLASAIMLETKSAAPRLPAPVIRQMNERINESIAQPRFASGLVAVFAGLALALAACGIYGVLSHLVAQRRREIGIRMALGGQRRSILGFVVARGMKPVLVGGAIGLLAAAALTRVIQSLLYGVAATDPMTFAAGCFLLLVVGLAASLLPAYRATQMDPMITLRAE